MENCFSSNPSNHMYTSVNLVTVAECQCNSFSMPVEQGAHSEWNTACYYTCTVFVDKHIDLQLVISFVHANGQKT